MITGRTLPIVFLSLIILMLVLTGTLARSRERTRLDTLEEKISLQSRLVTARETYREVIYSESSTLFTDKKLLFSADFTVEAGVDLRQCRLRRNWKGQLVLLLPSVRIFSIDCEEDTIQEYIAREFLTKITYSDYAPFIEEEKSRLREEALRSDLIPRAENNVRSFLRGLLSGSGLDFVRIRFRDTPLDTPQESPLPPVLSEASRG
jgi:hypothetical protein